MFNSLAEFYDLLSSSISVLGLEDTDVAREVKLAQKKLILCSGLFDKLNEVFRKCFNTSNLLLDFIWVFFFVLNSETNLRVLDFEEQYMRLQSLLNFIWDITPKNARGDFNPSFTNDFDIKISEDIKALPESIMKSLQEKQVFVTQENTDIFSHLSENLLRLKQYYENTKQKINPCDFDGLLFISNRKLVGPIDKIKISSVVQMNLHDYSNSDQSEKILFSPTGRGIQENVGRSISPLDATLYSISILTSNLDKESDSPNEILKEYFLSCDTNVTDLITSKLDSKLESIKLDDSMTQKAREDRIKMIKKLFFKVLYETLVGEENRRRTKNFTTLLQNDRFFTSLLACSIEAILFGYNIKHWIQFSELLKRMELIPFDFVKIIESFVLNTSWLTSPFKRHFRRIEETCVDSLGWTLDTPLFSNNSKLPEEITSMPKSNAPETPARKKHDRVYEAFTNKDQKSSPSLDFFFNKVKNLLSLRIRELCAMFDETSEDLIYKIWSIVNYVLQNERQIMIGRHLDQMIMCSLYICFSKIAKKTNVTFKSILFNYRIICEDNRGMSNVEILEIMNHIPITLKDGSLIYGDIVKFYNDIFITSVKDYVLKLCKNDTSTEQLEVPSMPDIKSPQRTRFSNSNIFLSPLKKSPKPGSRTLYSFGDHHTQKHVDEKTQSMGAPATPESRKKRKLFESNPNSIENRPNKRLVLNDSTLQSTTELLNELSQRKFNGDKA